MSVVWQRFLPDVPPPDFADIKDSILAALPTLQPLQRVDVPTWAELNRNLDLTNYTGKWKNDFAPYMREPARMITSRIYSAVVFAGPARAAKSEAVILNALGHAIATKPRDTMVVSFTQDGARAFSERKLMPMLRANPELLARQASGRGADNLYEKKFAGNMNLQIRWPVIGFFAQNEYFTVLLTDYDRHPADVDGEGTSFGLARKRIQQAGSLGMVVAESSPGRIIENDDWQAETIHEAPPCSGILAEYNNGTRGRFYWKCPHCGDAFRPEMARLHWEKKATPQESARTTVMICDSGCVIAPDRKNDLNLKGVWLHETADGQSAVEIGDSKVRSTDIVSYACEGPIAALQSWSEIVQRQIEAETAFERTGDETALKTTITLDQGRAYSPRIRSLGEGLSVDVLKALSLDYPMETAPAGTAFVVVAVDIQAGRFVVQADAFKAELERYLIDRFDLSTPPETSPNASKRTIDPGRYGEDWDVLFDLFERAYPLQDGTGSLQPRAVILDMRGEAGVTKNAYAFYKKARKRGYGGRVFLSNNMGGLTGDRAFFAEPEKILGQKRKRRSDIMLVRTRTDMIKDEVALALTRRDIGPGSYRLPRSMEERLFEEFCAEARTDEGWRKRKSNLRNESFDLAVYSKAAVIVCKGEKIDWSKPPSWARCDATNSLFLPSGNASSDADGEVVKADRLDAQKTLKARPRRRSPGFVRRGFNV